MTKTQSLTGTKTSRIFLLNILFLLFVNITFGQIVVETEKIDYINLEIGYFYCKDGNGKYRISDVELEKKEDNSILLPKIKYFETQEGFKEEECISYDNIATLTPDKFEQLFNRKKYMIYLKKKEKRIELAKFNKDHFIIFSYDYHKNDRKWKLNYSSAPYINLTNLANGDSSLRNYTKQISSTIKKALRE